MIGEIGGDAEERAAEFIQANVDEAGRRLRGRVHRPGGQDDGPRGRDRLGCAGTAQAKKVALEAAGVKVGKTPSETARYASIGHYKLVTKGPRARRVACAVYRSPATWRETHMTQRPLEPAEVPSAAPVAREDRCECPRSLRLYWQWCSPCSGSSGRSP